jgi:2-polyprenyl-3-methyl-5-hydroxy-6-metoxy-1,4-benzoquinol methylase
MESTVTVKEYTMTDADLKRIRTVPHFRTSIYRDLNIKNTLAFFSRRYVEPLSHFVDITRSVAVDCACGYGWFSLAYLLSGGRRVVAVDVDPERLEAAREIAKILRVDGQVEFIVSPIQNIPLGPNASDVFVSIETLEHIGKKNVPAALQRIKHITAKAVVLTTPNKLFPVIAHDTQLPFIHWLPANRRDKYATLFQRRNLNEKNEFLSPLDLNILLDKFTPATSCLTFRNFEDYRNHFPFYQPYGAAEGLRWIEGPGIAKSMYYWMSAKTLGRHSYWIMPSLARIFHRR